MDPHKEESNSLNPNKEKTETNKEEQDSLNDSITEELAPSLRVAGGDRKQQRTEMTSPRAKPVSPVGPPGFMVAASPPKFVSLDEIMKAAQGVGNMVLAHEIAVDSDFKVEKVELQQNSLEKQVRETIHRAFWDSLREKLAEDPPDFSHALLLLQEVKTTLLDLLLPYHGKLLSHINEVLDMELIKQKAEHEALDVRYYADFVISMMAKLCAPVRDEVVQELSKIPDIIPLFKEIFRVLDVMKMDMANFTIQQIRPLIQSQSVEYERKKFDDFLKVQEENNLDGLQYTKQWITRSADKLQYPETPDGGATAALPQPTPVVILTTAYMELLEWDENQTFPETLIMDAGRLMELCDKISRLTLISSILLVTYNTVGTPIAGIKDLKAKLKDNIEVILGDTPPKEVKSVMVNVAEQVNKDVAECLQQHGFSKLDEERINLLTGQIIDVAGVEHPVYKLLHKRILGFVYQLISTAQPQKIQFPPGVSTVAEELNAVCGQFLRLTSHNRSVFGAHYANIIRALLQRTEDVEVSA